jgi:hypothetical protein
LIESNEDSKMKFDNYSDYMDQYIPAGQFPTAKSGPIAQFLNGMPDWVNMTPEDINLAVESLPNPSQGHIPPAISLHDAIEHDRGKRAS